MTSRNQRSTRQSNLLWPVTKMGRLSLIVAGLWLLKSLVLEAIFPPTSMGVRIFYDLITLLLLIPITYYTVQVIRGLKRRLLWKIRRRLILSNIFIAVIPTLLITSIFLLSAWLIYYQFSSYLVLNQIGLHTGQVEAYTQALRGGIQNLLEKPSVDRSELRFFLNREAQFIQANYPQASISLQIGDKRSHDSATFRAGFLGKYKTDEYEAPKWLNGKDFSGLVYDPVDVGPLVKEEVFRRYSQWSDLFLRAVTFSDLHPLFDFSVEVSVPVDRFLLRKLKTALGVDLILARARHDGIPSTLEGKGLGAEDVITSTNEDLLNDSELSQSYPLPMQLYPIFWENGEENSTERADLLYMQVSLTRLYQNLFLSESKLGQDIYGILRFLLVFFLIAEAVSVLVGVLLTRSITGAVYNLDRGTEFIKRGDFNHRIVVKSDDQLGTLAESFNKMVESVQTLMRERVEKERLERELEIAQEVQTQLYPKSSPAVDGLDVSGICLPARTVSGDYYDYLLFTPQVVGIVIGDICGKGISAALLMANLQATLRGHFSSFEIDGQHFVHDRNRDTTVAKLMEQLNRQIVGFTSSNKFASLFNVVLDQRHGKLTYCNAGHNPPILLKSGQIHRLRTGGTVVGIFSEATYDQESITLQPGDLLLAYTDGISEAVNEFGEEFGETRLEEILCRNQDRSVDGIKDVVIDSILEWSHGQEREDDMTVVVARATDAWPKNGQQVSEISDQRSTNKGL